MAETILPYTVLGSRITIVQIKVFKEITEENLDYGGRIYPFELLFFYERMFR